MKSLLFLFLLCLTITTFGQSDDRAVLKETNGKTSAALQKKDFKTAVAYANQAIELNVRIYGENSRETAIAFENLGLILVQDNKHKLAVEPLRKSLELFRKDPEKNAPDISRTFERLGQALFHSGQKKEAETMFTEALNSANSTFGEGSKEMLSAKTGLACFHDRIGEDSKAFDEFADTYVTAIKKFGKGSTVVDQVVIGCESSFAEFFGDTLRGVEARRKKFDELLGYQLVRPTRIAKADFDITAKQIGEPNLIVEFAVVKVWVNEDGKPTDSKMIFGKSHFASFANNAAMASKYKPSVENGSPKSDVTYIKFLFLR